jgi:hypothetical protein
LRGFLSVTGPQIGVGTAVRDAAAIGCKPDSGWWGAKDCDEIFAGVGPDEHQTKPASGSTVILELSFKFKRWTVSETYFRLRLDRTRHGLDFRSKKVSYRWRMENDQTSA